MHTVPPTPVPPRRVSLPCTAPVGPRFDSLRTRGAGFLAEVEQALGQSVVVVGREGSGGPLAEKFQAASRRRGERQHKCSWPAPTVGISAGGPNLVDRASLLFWRR